MNYSFYQVDVFTNTPFSGNPLAVLFDVEELSSLTMQAIAQEMNLSETIFVLPPGDIPADFSVKIFTPEYFHQMRDSITQLYIEGPKPSNNLRSYMQVYDGLPLATQNITLNNKFGYEVKGWWDMKNGTMGGPFVSTAYVDEIRGRVLVVDAFVFGPNFNKRRFIKELEAICLTLKSAEEGI